MILKIKVFLVALILVGCSTGYTRVTSDNMYQSYSAQDCKINETELFYRLAHSIDPSASRGALTGALMVFLQNNTDIWEGVDSTCFYEAVITRNVPLYDSPPVETDAYYEFWIFAESSGKIEHVCIGVNTIGAHTPHFSDQDYPQKALHPLHYQTGFAKQIRYLPVCSSRDTTYRYLFE